MPLYMDVHHKVEGLTAEALAGAHAKDLEVQTQHAVNYRSIGSTRTRGGSTAS